MSIRPLARIPGPVDRRPRRPFSLDRKAGPPDTPDDDFNATTLDAKWTVLSGTPATVNPVGTAATGYDLASRPGWLLNQPKNSNSLLRMTQAYTLPDGRSIVAKVEPVATLGVGDSNSVWGPFIAVTAAGAAEYDSSDSNGTLTIGCRANGLYTKANTAGSLIANAIPLGLPCYLRIARNGLFYTSFYSSNGEDWSPVSTITAASARAKLWVAMASYSNWTGVAPIQAMDWIREGGNARRPWAA